MSYNRNPKGKNQHNAIPDADDPDFAKKLTDLFREGLGDKDISSRFEAECGLKISESTIKRRRLKLGLFGSKSAAIRNMSAQAKEQIVLQQLDKDPAQHQGAATIKAKINYDQNIRLPRAVVSSIMHDHNPDGFIKRGPNSKKVLRVPNNPIGVNERWSADGHDKLYKIGFPVWAVVDNASTRWLDAWVVPSNRMGDIIAYLFLCLVEDIGGMPLEFSTDCGSETTQVYGLAHALRDALSDIPNDEIPAHRYVRSVHNIAIERSWLRLRLDFGDNMVQTFEKGEHMGIYKPDDPNHHMLCQWLWSSFIRLELHKFNLEFRNGTRMRKDKNKAGPSGDSRNNMYLMPERWGGKDCLQKVDVNIIRELKEAIGGESLIQFVSPEYAAMATGIYEALGVSEITVENVWYVFEHMLPTVTALMPQ